MNADFNPEEAAICKRRGHESASALAELYSQKWSQCKWCGTWQREVRTHEERVDAPPPEDQAPTKVSFGQAAAA